MLFRSGADALTQAHKHRAEMDKLYPNRPHVVVGPNEFNKTNTHTVMTRGDAERHGHKAIKEAGKGAISADDIRSVLWKLFQQDAVMPAQGDNPELGLGDEEYSAFEEHAENILKFAQQHNITDAKEAVISYLTSKMRELQAQGSMPSGGSLHESRKLFAKIKETADVTDYNPPSQGGTRQELVAKYHQTKDPKDAEAARRAGATQQELQGVAEGSIKGPVKLSGPKHFRLPPERLTGAKPQPFAVWKKKVQSACPGCIFKKTEIGRAHV